MLDVCDVRVSFGGVTALESASLTVDEGGFTGLIGPNGAGKTTLFNCVSGFVTPARGSITCNGRDLVSGRAHRAVSAGIARTFQNLGLVPEASVLDNVLLGAHPRTSGSFLTAPLGVVPAVRRSERAARAKALDVLDELGLAEVTYAPCTDLPFGTLKRVELARALLAEPRLLLLDEPAGGLPRGEVDELAATLRRLSERHGVTVLLVEHHMGLVMGLCDTVIVLDAGRVIASGTPDEVRADERVIGAYLGAAGGDGSVGGAGE